jgi:hypothetical protein
MPDHSFSKNLVVLGMEPKTSGSVARNSDHETTEAVSLPDMGKEFRSE